MADFERSSPLFLLQEQRRFPAQCWQKVFRGFRDGEPLRPSRDDALLRRGDDLAHGIRYRRLCGGFDLTVRIVAFLGGRKPVNGLVVILDFEPRLGDVPLVALAAVRTVRDAVLDRGILKSAFTHRETGFELLASVRTRNYDSVGDIRFHAFGL
jgi:hypothetical protein